MPHTISLADKDTVVDVFMAWARQEQWNPGVHDGASFFASDPQGFFVLRAEKSDEIIAMCSCVVNGGEAFVGFYIVRKDMRGRGYGREIFGHALSHAGAANVGLDAVPQEEKTYEKSGFRRAYTSMRYSGVVRPYTGDIRHGELKRASDVDFDQLSNFDQLCFPAQREAFLAHWIRLPESISLVSIDSTTQEINGFGAVRRGQLTLRVGPLFAKTTSVAENLLKALIDSMHTRNDSATQLVGDADRIFSIDVPSLNPLGIEMVKQIAPEQSFLLIRMYTKGYPSHIHPHFIFGTTSATLG